MYIIQVGLAARVEKVSREYRINSDIIWHHGPVIVPISQQKIRPKQYKTKVGNRTCIIPGDKNLRDRKPCLHY